MTTSIHINADLLSVIDACIDIKVAKPVAVTINEATVTITDSSRNKYWVANRAEDGTIRISENDCVFNGTKEDDNW